MKTVITECFDIPAKVLKALIERGHMTTEEPMTLQDFSKLTFADTYVQCQTAKKALDDEVRAQSDTTLAFLQKVDKEALTIAVKKEDGALNTITYGFILLCGNKLTKTTVSRLAHPIVRDGSIFTVGDLVRKIGTLKPIEKYCSAKNLQVLKQRLTDIGLLS